MVRVAILQYRRSPFPPFSIYTYLTNVHSLLYIFLSLDANTPGSQNTLLFPFPKRVSLWIPITMSTRLVQQISNFMSSLIHIWFQPSYPSARSSLLFPKPCPYINTWSVSLVTLSDEVALQFLLIVLAFLCDLIFLERTAWQAYLSILHGHSRLISKLIHLLPQMVFNTMRTANISYLLGMMG